jgi:zinc transport system substrate-binding protein
VSPTIRAAGLRQLISALTVPLALLIGLSGCSSSKAGNVVPTSTYKGKVTKVAVGSYALGYLVKGIGGESVEVTNLTPPGVEPHDVELSPDLAAVIEDADLVVLIGGGFQPSLERAADRRAKVTIDVHSNEIAFGAKKPFTDPHIWLDPVMFAEQVAPIMRSLSALNSTNESQYVQSSGQLRNELMTLDKEYAKELKVCARRELIVSHSAFGHLANRYQLSQLAIAGLSPTNEPTANRLSELTDLVKSTNATTIFTEENVSPAVADTLARETGIRTQVLSPLEFAPKVGDYMSVMRTNLSEIKTALACS